MNQIGTMLCSIENFWINSTLMRFHEMDEIGENEGII